jgi:hypothetical protein
VREDTQFVAGGAALGAILGAVVAWVYVRRSAQTSEGSVLPGTPDARRLLRLGVAVIGVVRQVLELR